MNTNYTSKIDPDSTIQGLKTGKIQFKDLDEETRNNRRYALYAIKINAKNALYLGNDLKNDSSLILEALKINSSLYNEIVPENKRNNFNFIFDIIKTIPSIILSYSDKFRENSIYMEKAIESNILTFSYISEKLKNDKNFIISLIHKNPNIYFQLGFSELSDDIDVINAYNESKNKKNEFKFEFEEISF